MSEKRYIGPALPPFRHRRRGELTTGSAMRLTSALVAGILATAACPAPLPSQANPGTVLTQTPSDVDPAARYLLYLHGRIIEDQGVRPTHPRFGVYEYQAILETLADRGLTVISEVRLADANVDEWAQRVTAQVTSLLEAGVPPGHITVMGFSKGCGIAVLASARLANPKVNFVFIACCGPWIERALAPSGSRVAGRILALREASDDLAGPCAELLANAVEGSTQREVVLELGGGHGAFYRPRPEWIEPVLGWAAASRVRR